MPASVQPATRVTAILGLTFLGSVATSVFWNAMGFVAKHGYGFSQTESLLLSAGMGVIYTAGAFGSGGIVRRLSPVLAPRSLLTLVLIAQAAFSLLPVLAQGSWTLLVAGGGISFSSSLLWPVVESYLSSGRKPADMARVLGAFNVTWMVAVIVPFLAMPFLLEHHATWVLGAQCLVNLAALVPLQGFTKAPAHGAVASSGPTPAGYARLLPAARVLIVLSYVLNAALAPILPYRFDELALPTMAEAPIASTWMMTRVLVVVLLWKASFWHGRFAALWLGGAALAGGFALVLLGHNLLALLCGFALFGVGTGITYFAAIYYAMVVGSGEVDAGGKREGVIGTGYILGPLSGLGGAALAGNAGVVGVAWGLCGLAIGGVLRIYFGGRGGPARRPPLEAPEHP